MLNPCKALRRNRIEMVVARINLSIEFGTYKKA